MSPSQFAIFCIILITLFPLHEFVDGQVLGPGLETCVQIKCGENNELNCPCCVAVDGLQYRCFPDMKHCLLYCGKSL
ncbi:hypothetical protein N665_1259s0002 [Sinapis alba]|nr:hypothetical protein N665_1259s0002 [Sinapis alba]